MVGQAERDVPRNRQVSELSADLRAPASHTCRGPECSGGQPLLAVLRGPRGGAQQASGRWRMKHFITDSRRHSRPARSGAKRILKLFAETSCAAHSERDRNSVTATKDSGSGSNPRSEVRQAATSARRRILRGGTGSQTGSSRAIGSSTTGYQARPLHLIHGGASRHVRALCARCGQDCRLPEPGVARDGRIQRCRPGSRVRRLR
jgi:hypothetical protein